jgi:ubiquinone/menaquinone biosynthesis C-methylase UbiE
MVYKIKFYNQGTAVKREKYFEKKSIFKKIITDTNRLFFDYIIEAINRLSHKNKNRIKILDLGTGTGYVPRILALLSKTDFKIIGVDLAPEMLNMAKLKTKDSRIKYLLGDNKNLPFKSKSFDIVTNKLSTQFDLIEVKRVLKNNGFFIFKEYDKYKGFKEIAEKFKNRYKKSKTNASDYVKILQNLNFHEIILRAFFLKRKYSLQEIKDIFEMTNLIDGFSSKDLNLIKNKIFNKGKKADIHLDPFIIFAQK